MYVSTITADEIVYAGSKYSLDSLKKIDQFLVNNYQRNNNLNYFTLSPSHKFHINSLADFGFIVVGDNYGFGMATGALGQNTIYSNHSFRPTIILDKDIEITSGDGTQFKLMR